MAAPGMLPPIRKGAGRGSRSSLRLTRMDIEAELTARFGSATSERPPVITLDEIMKPKPTFEEIKQEMAGVDLTRFGKTSYEATCLDMLEQGCHRAFKELFDINEQQKADREAAGKDSGYYYDPMVIDSDEKLQHLKTFLITGEVGQRTGNMEQVYSSQLQLAQYFEETQDLWLSDRFYQACLKTAKSLGNHSQQKEGEANANIGLAYEARGRFLDAVKHFEKFFKLASTSDPPWFTLSGENMIKTAASHLCRIYTTLAEEVFDEDRDQAIAYLHNSLERARKVDAPTEGLAHYRLGNAFQASGEFEKAVEHQRAYFEKCRQSQDDEGIARACEGLARAYESLERWDEAIQNLEVLKEVADRCSDKEMLTKSLRQLGALKNMLGRFEEGVSDLDHCYNLQTGELADQVSAGVVNTARTQYSSCKGHAYTQDVCDRLVGVSGGHAVKIASLNDLVRWKDLRMLQLEAQPEDNAPVHVPSDAADTDLEKEADEGIDVGAEEGSQDGNDKKEEGEDDEEARQ